MDKEEIDSLFAQAAEGVEQQDEATRAVFGALINSTLEYRDQVYETKGIKLTVADVQQRICEAREDLVGHRGLLLLHALRIIHREGAIQ